MSKIKCRNCTKLFKTKPCLIKNGRRKYCNKKCYSEALSIINKEIGKIPPHPKGKDHPRFQNAISIYTCSQCKTKFKRFKSQSPKFCSYKCYWKSKEDWWKIKENREKQISLILKGLLKRPTSLEKRMIQIIKKHNLPYKYVGDGSFLIGWKNPDFINTNGKKVAIEVANEFHHSKTYPRERKNYFKEYGWKAIVFHGDKLIEKNVLKILS